MHKMILLRKMPARLVTVGDVAYAFERSEQTIRIWMRDRGLPYVRIAGARRDAVRFDPDEVREWAAAFTDPKVIPNPFALNPAGLED